jgi:hypothetical protein
MEEIQGIIVSFLNSITPYMKNTSPFGKGGYDGDLWQPFV